MFFLPFHLLWYSAFLLSCHCIFPNSSVFSNWRLSLGIGVETPHSIVPDFCRVNEEGKKSMKGKKFQCRNLLKTPLKHIIQMNKAITNKTSDFYTLIFLNITCEVNEEGKKSMRGMKFQRENFKAGPVEREGRMRRGLWPKEERVLSREKKVKKMSRGTRKFLTTPFFLNYPAGIVT